MLAILYFILGKSSQKFEKKEMATQSTGMERGFAYLRGTQTWEKEALNFSWPYLQSSFLEDQGEKKEQIQSIQDTWKALQDNAQ